MGLSIPRSAVGPGQGTDVERKSADSRPAVSQGWRGLQRAEGSIRAGSLARGKGRL